MSLTGYAGSWTSTANTAEVSIMEASQACPGRVFVLRLHDGEVLHESVEDFAFSNNIKAATVIAVGGAGKGSKLTVGPKVPIEGKIEPLYHVLNEPHELTGSGTIFTNQEGRPIMHMHCSCGREGTSVTGCVRSGVITVAGPGSSDHRDREHQGHEEKRERVRDTDDR